ncbi:O-antigen ligase family protein [Herbivorax sp. ANBcel31]|uniref:O-antigen ligase family protein n=1 Tax=Herbivorax sp. ANBcel31 TaxID=3069754 RepID=UPI0027B51ED3|nr:O-antigen ligase family protein [Herbivorax sp. ANBcel31]MDQ2085618.1 O-antigen ligase family protein [Herbivorax sp. ANBcel31]
MYDSVFIKAVLFITSRIDSSYENSFFKKVIDFIINIFKKLNVFYENSIAGRSIKRLAELFHNSAILGFFFKKGSLSKWYEESLFFVALNGIVNFPSRLFKKAYLIFEEVFLESKIICLIRNVLSRMEIIAGLLMVLLLVVPNDRWNNRYNLIIAFALTGLVFINTVIQRNWKFNVKAMDFTLIIFMITVAVSVIATFSESINFLAFYITCFILVMAMVSFLKTEKSLKTFIEIILIGVVITGIYGIWQVATDAVAFDPSLTDIEQSEGLPGRIYSSMGNPNNYAQILIMFLPFFASIIMNSKSFLKKSLYLIMALPPLLALFYTGSRSGWIGLAVAIMVFVFFAQKRLIPFIIVGGIIMIPFLPAHMYYRLLTIFNTEGDTSTQYRVEILQTIYPMLKDHAVLGSGLGTDAFMRVVNNYYQYTKGTPVHTHVLYLQIWIEMGIVAILSFMWFTYRTIKNSIICMADSTREMKNILIAGVSSLAGVLTIGIVEYIWYYPRVMVIFWLIIGILLSGISIVFNKNRKLSES